jgi:UDP-glucose 4-epimerase
MLKKKILVTGVAGMVGSHLLDELLKTNVTVVGIDDLSFGSFENIKHNESNSNFTFHKESICNLDFLKEISKEVSTIVHLAAYKKISENEKAMPAIEINGKGTENVFEVAKVNGAKVIYASTSDVYGMSSDLPLKETGNLLLGASDIKRWTYAVSKLYGEHMAMAYHKDYDVPVVILRYFGGFSSRSNFTWSGGHIPIFIRAILNDEEVIIHGDGEQTRSMGHVDDIVAGTLLAMGSDKAIGQIINIGNDEELSIIDSAKLIHKMMMTENALKLKFVPMESIFGDYVDIQRRIPDLQMAKNILGYVPKVNFELALRRTIDSIKSEQ